MDLINSHIPDNQGKWDFDTSAKRYSSQQLTRITESHKENKDITIFTEEGDRVTITSDQQTQESYSKYSATVHQSIFAATDNMAVHQDHHAMIQQERFEFESNRTFSISVDGDLNEQELKDIKKAIKAIDKLMTDLLHGGDIINGLGQAIELGKSDSISGITAKYSQEKSISVEQIIKEEISTYNRDGQIEGFIPGDRTDGGRIKNLINEMIRIIENTAVDPANFIKPLKMMFREILKNLTVDMHQNRLKIDLTKLIEAALMKKIEQVSEPPEFPLKPSSPEPT